MFLQNCGTGGLGMGSKWLISGVVVLAACAVVVARVAGEKESAPKAEQGFALPAVAAPAAAAEDSPEIAGWDAPLKGLSELNVVATKAFDQAGVGFAAIPLALPLGGLMLGVSFGAAAVKFKGLETAVRGLAGVLLVAAGFYFLWSF